LSAEEAVDVLGVQGTPSFLVGRSTSDGVDGEWIVGAMPLGIFQSKIEAYGEIER
jgi:hypothetical protein